MKKPSNDTMKNGIIYKTTNLINGKFYVGKDSNNNPEYLGSGRLLCKAIDKYGRESFVKEIIEECSLDIINEREKYWISELNAIQYGYNIAEGGIGGDTRKGMDDVSYNTWLRNKSEVLIGKPSKTKCQGRPDFSENLKQLHASGHYTYTHLHRPMSEDNKQKMQEGRKRNRHDVVCEKCGRVISYTHIKPHQRSKKCK